MGGQEAGLEVGAREDSRAALAQEGVSAPVVDHVLSYNRVGSLDAAVGLVAVFLAVIFSATLIIFARRIEAATRPDVLDIAVHMDGLLYAYDFSAPLIPALFGAFLISVALGMFAALSPASWRPTVFIAFVTKLKQNRFSRWLLGRMLARLAGETDPARFVRRFVFMPAWFLMATGGLFLALSVPVAMWEVRAFEVFTPEGYYVSPLFPWSTPRLHSWASAAYVETGCSHYSRKGRTDNSMIYRVTLADRTVAYPTYVKPVRGSWLDGMETIDKTLRSAGVRFTPWSLNDPYDPRCIRAMRRKFSADEFARLRRILRFPN